MSERPTERDGRLTGSHLIAFCLMTGTTLAAQIVVSRLLASILSYYFAFIVVSLAMLGIASGALLVQQRPGFFTAEKLGGHAAVLSLLSGLAAALGTVGVLQSYVLIAGRGAYLGLAGVVLSLFPFFFFAGLTVSLVLFVGRADFARTYAYDLAGAAGGSLAAIFLLSAKSPVEVMLGAVAVAPALAAALFALRSGHRRLAALSIGVALLLVGATHFARTRPEFVSPKHVNFLSARHLLVGSNSFSSVAVRPVPFFTWSLSSRYPGPPFSMLTLVIDGIGGTQIVAFDGRPSSLPGYQYLDYDLTALGQDLVPPEGRQLIIGPGGGVDVLQGVRRGRSDITAVEINPLVASTVNVSLAGFSGRPYDLPGVRVFIENGRTFIRRSAEKWSLISLTWVDAGGSATALAASENFLYTVEAYEEFLRHLEPHGYLAFMRALGARQPDSPVDTLRGISVTVEALARLGIADAGDHMVVAAVESPHFFHRGMCYVLIKRSAFTTAEVDTVRGFLDRMAFQPIWLPGGGPRPEDMPPQYGEVARLVAAVVTSRDRAAVYRQAPIDIEPSTDDNPFYFVERGGLNRMEGNGIRMLKASCLLLSVLAILFVGVPLVPTLPGAQGLTVPEGAFLAYCALVGSGFMLVEIELFHVFALVLGSPTHALATVLASLLVFSGAGSLLAGRPAHISARMVGISFVALVVLLAGLAIAKGTVGAVLVTHSLPMRVLMTVLVIAPLATAMGLPMATGMRLAPARAGLMMWGWALNGAFSVVSSVAAVLLAIHVGIARTFAIGVACYAGAGLLLLVVERARREEPS